MLRRVTSPGADVQTRQASEAQLSEVAGYIESAGLPVLVIDEYVREMERLERGPMELDFGLWASRLKIRTGGVGAAGPYIDRSLSVPGLRVSFPAKGTLPPGELSLQVTLLRLFRIRGTVRRQASTITVFRIVEIYLRGAVFLALVANLVSTLLGQLSLSTIREIPRSVVSAFGAMPALVAVLIFMFATGDAWRLFGSMSNWRLGVTLGAFLVIGTVLLRLDLRPERRLLLDRGETCDLASDLEGVEEVKALLSLMPAPDRSPLGFWPRRNVGVVLTAYGAVRLFAVGLVVAAGFAVVGMLVVSDSATMSLVGDQQATVLWTFSAWGHPLIISLALVRVSLMLGGIALLYFSAVSLQSETARHRFMGDITGIHLRRPLAAYRFYRGAVSARESSP
jgi:hypothetical protein